MTRILIRGARQVLTVRGAPTPRRGTELDDLAVIEDGSILIEDGLIRDVGPTRRIENLSAARKALEIPAFGRVIMPGFVDCSSQLISSPSPLATATLAQSAKAIVRRCIQYGTTIIEAKSGSGLNAAAELKLLRAIPQLTRHLPLEIVSTYFAAASQIPVDEWIEHCMPELHRKNLASMIVVSCDPSSFNAAQCRALLAAAQSLAWPTKVYTGITVPSQGVQLAVEFESIAAENLQFLSDSDIRLLGASDVIAVLMPSFRYHDPSGDLPPAQSLIERGAAIAIASGYNRSSSPVFSMPMAVAAACRDLRMTPSQAISAATINAAHATGLGHRAGSIEPGKEANLLMLETSDYRDLARETGINPVHLTMIHGEVVCRNTSSFLEAFAG